MEAFGIIAVSLLSIQITLLFMLMNIQSKCSSQEMMESLRNPWASPSKILLGGMPVRANTISDQPGIEEETIHSEFLDPLADPDKKKTLTERLSVEIADKNSFSLSSKDDKYESETDKEKNRAGNQDVDSNNKTDGHLYENHIKWNNGNDLSKYRERLQMNRVDHMDPQIYSPPIVIDKTVDTNVAIDFILSEPRNNLRY